VSSKSAVSFSGCYIHTDTHTYMHARVAQIGHDGLCRISSVASDVPPFVSFVVTHSQSATLWQWRPLYNALMTYALCPNDLCPNALCPNALCPNALCPNDLCPNDYALMPYALMPCSFLHFLLTFANLLSSLLIISHKTEGT